LCPFGVNLGLLNKIMAPDAHVEPQTKYDVFVVYGAMDGSDDLTKESMYSECNYRYVCVDVV
jgi:hypothetical protein